MFPARLAHCRDLHAVVRSGRSSVKLWSFPTTPIAFFTPFVNATGVVPSLAKSMWGLSLCWYVTEVPSLYLASAVAAVPVYFQVLPSTEAACAVQLSQSYIWWNTA